MDIGIGMDIGMDIDMGIGMGESDIGMPCAVPPDSIPSGIWAIGAGMYKPPCWWCCCCCDGGGGGGVLTD